jgi:Eukaryotic translation initiation factor 4E binding protein (EIF4EBP)
LKFALKKIKVLWKALETREKFFNSKRMANTTAAFSISSDRIEIPKRDDGWAPDPKDLATTPGGTLFAVTPGGTRIVYDRLALLKLARSPLSKSPIALPDIPGVTVSKTTAAPAAAESKPQPKTHAADHKDALSVDNDDLPLSKSPEDDSIFAMEGL